MALKHDGHFSTYRNVMLASLLQHKEDFKGLAGKVNMITVVLLKAVAVLGISSDTLKAWG